MKTLTALAVALLLTGCAEARTLSHAAVEQKIQYNDSQAALYMVVPCNITVGAYFRRLSPDQRRAIDALCGGEVIPTLDPLTGLLE